MHDEDLIEQITADPPCQPYVLAEPVAAVLREDALQVARDARALTDALVADAREDADQQRTRAEAAEAELKEARAALEDALAWLRQLRPKVAFCCAVPVLDALSTFLEKHEGL